MKVAQLGGETPGKTAYKHGEECMSKTIIGMAQDYIGSNNLPLLVPDGQFGTRDALGKDWWSSIPSH